jgi:SAM-dependent methyltransferase
VQRETDLLDERHRVLHLAPERVIANLIRHRPNLSYVSGDLNPGAAMEVMDVTALPRPEGAFDVILCNHVLEHITDDRLAMSELYRVLEPGGRAYMQHPIDYALEKTYEDASVTSEADRQREFGQEDHVRWYGRDFVERLRGAGFEVDFRRYVDELDADAQARYAVAEPAADRRGSDIYVCTRPA